MRYDGSQAIKSMDDEENLKSFLSFCKEKNSKLKPSKMNISEEVEFGRALIRSDIMKNEQVVSVLHKDKRIQVFFELKKPSTKKVIKDFCGMLASLQSWNPNLSMNIPMLRKTAGSRGKVVWNEELEAKYQAVMMIMQNQIRLSPYDTTKKVRLVVDHAKGTGFLLIQHIN